jgi:hypothetical protein
MAHQRGRKKVTGTSKLPTKIRCIHLEEEYILWTERTGRLVAGSKEDLKEEDNEAWKAQTEDSERVRGIMFGHLGMELAREVHTENGDN